MNVFILHMDYFSESDDRWDNVLLGVFSTIAGARLYANVHSKRILEFVNNDDSDNNHNTIIAEIDDIDSATIRTVFYIIDSMAIDAKLGQRYDPA